MSLLTFVVLVLFCCFLTFARINEHIYGIGLNNFGQIGVGDTSDRLFSSKVNFFGDKTVVDIILGQSSTLYLTSMNRVFAVGRNEFGQLGIGHEIDQVIPIEITSLRDKNITKFAKGTNTNFFVVQNEKDYWGFGYNINGELCLGNTINYAVPKQITYFSNRSIEIQSVFVGNWGTFVVSKDRRVYSCGSMNIQEKIRQLDQLRNLNVVHIGVGENFMHALTFTGQVYSMGNNLVGQLGFNYSVPFLLDWIPLENPNLKEIQRIWVCPFHVFAESNGQIYGFGANTKAQLGLGASNNTFVPILLPHMTSVNFISCGVEKTLFYNGSLYSHGSNLHGRLGIPADSRGVEILYPTATIVPYYINKNITGMYSGTIHSMIIINETIVTSFGANGYGQLAMGDVRSRLRPRIAYTMVTNAIATLNLGYAHTLFLDQNGAVWSVGGNQYGQLGLGDWHYRKDPNRITVIEDEDIVDLNAGAYFSFLLTRNQTIFGFGDNKYGQLGVGDQESRAVPVLVPLLTGKGIVKIAGGTFHTLFLTSSGTVYSAGRNLYGQCGIDYTFNSHADELVKPHLITELLGKKIVKVSAGYAHSLVLDDQGKLYCFGWNDYGSCGVGSNWSKQDISKISIPNQYLIGINIVQIEAGHSHSIVLADSKRVYTFGRNHYGQLGYQSLNATQVESINFPVEIVPLRSKLVSRLNSGTHFTLVRTENSTIYGFGANNFGQLGNGQTSQVYDPIFISDRVVYAAAGYSTTFLEYTDDLLCYGIHSADSRVCSGHGNCRSFDICQCNSDYAGEKCQHAKCFGITAESPESCNGNGKCVDLNRCECTIGRYGGLKCDLPLCYGQLATASDVCTGHGTCIGPNQCNCTSGWQGKDCDTPVCFGFVKNDPKSCNFLNGTCVTPNNCTCDTSRYVGPNCDIPICNGVPGNDPMVCSRQGECIHADRCQCVRGKLGPACQFDACYQKSANDSLVCSGFGTCVAWDVCTCRMGFYGPECKFAIYWITSSTSLVILFAAILFIFVTFILDMILIRNHIVITTKVKYDWKRATPLTQPLINVTQEEKQTLLYHTE